ncbi:MAG: universal stress protein [Polaromonas sp.]
MLDCNEIAQWSRSELTLIAVMPRSTVGLEGRVYNETLQEREKDRYLTTLYSGVRKLTDAGLSARGELVTGEPVSEITSCAGRIKANLIVVGHKHMEGWATRWWRGSVSKALIEHAPCSVLVVITH